MGQDQREGEGPEANQRGRKGGHECCRQSEMGQGEGNQKEGLSQQSSNQSQTQSGSEGEVGEGQAGGEDQVVRFPFVINTDCMKKRILLLLGIILTGLITGNLKAEQTAVIKVDLDRKIAKVDPNIYGAFLEPIRTVVYGSIYAPESTFADENGFRKDYIQLIQQLHIPVVRWPGGNYVSGYRWEDGVGPKDQRPARLDLAWHRIDHNQMGTDEYATFSSLIGAEDSVASMPVPGRWIRRGIGSNTAIIQMGLTIRSAGVWPRTAIQCEVLVAGQRN